MSIFHDKAHGSADLLRFAVSFIAHILIILLGFCFLKSSFENLWSPWTYFSLFLNSFNVVLKTFIATSLGSVRSLCLKINFTSYTDKHIKIIWLVTLINSRCILVNKWEPWMGSFRDLLLLSLMNRPIYIVFFSVFKLIYCCFENRFHSTSCSTLCAQKWILKI